MNEKLGIRFQLDTGVAIEPDYADVDDRLDIKSKHKSDVVAIDIISTSANADQLADLNTFFEEDLKNYNGQLVNSDTVGERRVAMPFYEDRALLFYRKDLLDDIERAPPRTWDEMEEIAEKIQERQKNKQSTFIGFSWQGAEYEGLTCNALEWIASWGSHDDKTGHILVDSAAARKALEHAWKWVSGPGEKRISSGVWEYKERESLETFVKGEAAFLRMWQSAYATLIEEGWQDATSSSCARVTKNEKCFGVRRLPVGEAGHASVSVLGGWQLAIPRYSRRQLEAAEFIRYNVSPEVQAWRWKMGAYIPTTTIKGFADFDRRKKMPGLEQVMRSIQLIARPFNKSYSEVSSCVYRAIHVALKNLEDDAAGKVMSEIKKCGMDGTIIAAPVTSSSDIP